MIVERVTVWLVEVPQREPVAPYRSHVRTSSTTTKGIVLLRTDEGLEGLGEFNLNFLSGRNEERMQSQAEWIVGRDPMQIAAFHETCPLETRLKSGIELALWDVTGKALGVPVSTLLGGVVRDRIELAACMGIQPYERAGELATYYVERGFTTLKTKAGADAREDLEMVRGVRDAVGDRLRLRIDPNRAYSRDEAAELAVALEEYGLEYFEQPIPAEPLSDARWLRERTSTPIALNESVVDPASVLAILREEAASHVLPDTHVAGGILPCVKIGTLCEAAGIPCIMHCGHDLGPKTAAMLHVAASRPAYSLANDSTYYGLVDDVVREPFRIESGRIRVPTSPGLGVEADLEKIERFRRPSD